MRLYIGTDHKGCVIVDGDDRVLTLEEIQWKAFKAAGGDLESISLLPKDRDIDMVAAYPRN